MFVRNKDSTNAEHKQELVKWPLRKHAPQTGPNIGQAVPPTILT
ncbi:hypothetical protein SLEP1_g42291 [Rubroshorea leprosula]|uniref:Uncharacterized protein n=1 Tax=Rubroshorea leprosula TaxID=152421 RepID=A0AAV5L9B1_9ROSI|nr:hypothetical protein SLEP1_g42291 [Rubroshorea leprosula]